MPDSAVVRNRRSRKHKRDDHSECLLGHCDAVTPQVSEPITPPVTDVPQLSAAGSQLWRDMSQGLAPMHRVLLLEACRIADRLDKLDRKLRGEDRDWLTLQLPEDGSIAVVVVDKALSEARQQATALKQIVAELRQTTAVKQGKPVPSRQPSTAGGTGGSLSDLTARIAQRDGASAG